MQSLSDQGNLANLSAFLQNAVLFIVATTHVIELTRSAITGNAGKCSLLLCPKVKDRLSTYSDAKMHKCDCHAMCCTCVYHPEEFCHIHSVDQCSARTAASRSLTGVSRAQQAGCGIFKLTRQVQ